jgi:hypothetical protein
MLVRAKFPWAPKPPPARRGRLKRRQPAHAARWRRKLGDNFSAMETKRVEEFILDLNSGNAAIQLKDGAASFSISIRRASWNALNYFLVVSLSPYSVSVTFGPYLNWVCDQVVRFYLYVVIHWRNVIPDHSKKKKNLQRKKHFYCI